MTVVYTPECGGSQSPVGLDGGLRRPDGDEKRRQLGAGVHLARSQERTQLDRDAAPRAIQVDLSSGFCTASERIGRRRQPCSFTETATCPAHDEIREDESMRGARGAPGSQSSSAIWCETVATYRNTYCSSWHVGIALTTAQPGEGELGSQGRDALRQPVLRNGDLQGRPGVHGCLDLSCRLRSQRHHFPRLRVAAATQRQKRNRIPIETMCLHRAILL